MMLLKVGYLLEKIRWGFSDSCLRTGERKRQIDIANAADVTEVTIRNRLKELKSRLELDR